MSKNRFQCNYMNHPYSIPFQSLEPSPLKPQDFTSPNKTLNVCVCVLCECRLHIYGTNFRMEINFFVFK